MLPEPDTTHGWTWRFDAGEISVRRDAAGFVLRAPSLDEPLALPGDGPASLTEDLGSDPVVARLVRPLVVNAGQTVSLQLAWPLLLNVRWAGDTIETWRHGVRRTLLGAVQSGLVVDAVRTEVLATGTPAPPGFASLHVRITNPQEEPARARRIAFLEDGLTLWREDRALHAGRVEVRILSGEQGEARCSRPALPPEAEVLRAGNRQLDGTEATPTNWWLQGSRRSMGFQV